MTSNKNSAIPAGEERTRLFASDIDWWTVAIYVVMVVFGLVNIYAAVFDEDAPEFFDFARRSGKQALWAGISFFSAICILLIDGKYWHLLAYPIYFLMLGVMLFVVLFGTEVNGAKAWIDVGSIRIQPVEFMKFGTALALARYMSAYNFNLKSGTALYYIGLIIGGPILLILLQNDTGSGLVFAAFFIMLYREGMGAGLYIFVLVMIFLGIISFLLEPFPLAVIVLLICLSAQGAVNGNWRDTLRYLALVFLFFLGIETALFLTESHLSSMVVLLISMGLSIPFLVRYSLKKNVSNLWMFAVLFIGAIVFTNAVDYMFDNVLQTHQQKRILDILGIENDPHKWSYNVIQSKIAIGSGGFLGKGFLGGTQTRFSFVPEQSTDFIFCTVGEEWGFVGALFVVVLFVMLILRLMSMGERQKEPFGRIYCYSVAAIFFMHFFINIGMTIGLFPVVGIPLPFFSYGGSSLLAFTILLFVAIRLDASQYDENSRKLL